MCSQQVPKAKSPLRHLRVFLSSPGDVIDERGLALHLLKEELAYESPFRGRVTFDVVSWDDPAAPTPMPHGGPVRRSIQNYNKGGKNGGASHVFRNFSHWRKDSEIRKHADNIIKRVIMPSLSGLNFQTIRVDLSFANSRISDEIVTLIKNSELCIVDSSGHNPNVMYELGRRHQTGKPVILMRPTNQDIIFDLKDIKHIEYDLDDVDSVIETQDLIRQFIDEFSKQGFISSDSDSSIESIAFSINRLGQRVDDIAKYLARHPMPNQDALRLLSTRTEEIVESLGLGRAFAYCIQKKMVREAEEIYDRLEPALSRSTQVNTLADLAGIGSRRAWERLEAEMIPLLTQFDVHNIKNVTYGYVAGAGEFDEEERALKIIVPIVEDEILHKDAEAFTNQDKAFCVNQIGHLYYGLKTYRTALDQYEKAMSFAPDDAAYVHNASGAAHLAGEIDKALQYVDKVIALVSLEKMSVSYLERIYQAYKSAGKIANASEILDRIKKVNPILAAMRS
jgi:tetratricopeptide (TPR) repeat protein